jgi:hypothetical protein
MAGWRVQYNVAAAQLKQILRPTLLEYAALELDEVVADKHREQRGGRRDERHVEGGELQEIYAGMESHVCERNGEVNQGKNEAAGLTHALQRHPQQRASRAKQGVQDVVAKGARKPIQHLEQIVNDEQLEVVLALDEMIPAQNVTKIGWGKAGGLRRM